MMQAFSWGCNKFRQVSNISLDWVSKPRQIALSKKIVQAACGADFSLVLTEDGEVYGWRSNSFGQLGNNWRIRNYVDRIKSLPRIVKVVCGQEHTLALTVEGELYAWGRNSAGELGIGNTINTCNPCMIKHEMGQVVDIAALHSHRISVAVDKNGCVYMWGLCHGQKILVPTLAPFSTVHDVIAHYVSLNVMHKPLILRMTEESNILKCVENAFNDESTSDLTIRVENQPIYVHKAILKIRCLYFKNMFQHNWSEKNQSAHQLVLSVIEHSQFSYTVFKAFLRYLYTSVIDLPLKKTFELLKLADFYCETNLKRRCIQLIKKKISTKNVIFLYCTAIEYNTKELEEFCFKFALHHMTEVVKTKDFVNLNKNTQNIFRRQAIKARAFKDTFLM